MDINIIEDKKARLVFEIKGEGHTLGNIVTKTVNGNSHVKTSGYNVAHPLVGVPTITIETDGADPRSVLADAVKQLKKECSGLKKSFDKELK